MNWDKSVYVGCAALLAGWDEVIACEAATLLHIVACVADAAVGAQRVASHVCLICNTLTTAGFKCKKFVDARSALTFISACGTPRHSLTAGRTQAHIIHVVTSHALEAASPAITLTRQTVGQRGARRTLLLRSDSERSCTVDAARGTALYAVRVLLCTVHTDAATWKQTLITLGTLCLAVTLPAIMVQIVSTRFADSVNIKCTFEAASLQILESKQTQK